MPAMAENPSADKVGREFVRQYYTMLNKDPRQVHRFYSKDSVFFHGGPSNTHILPAVGQEQIYEKIEQLKFNDCHAKILQVDSQFTVGKSVVVQVCGEFSNNNEPTKKFVQTFVLVPESSRKYHVHNDIFRYQEERYSDEVSDEAGEGTIDSECDEDVVDEHSLENNKSNDFDKLIKYSEDEESSGLELSNEEEEEEKVSPMTNGSTAIDYDDLTTKESDKSQEAELEEVVVEKPAPIETPTTTIYSNETQEDTDITAETTTADENLNEEVVEATEPHNAEVEQADQEPEPEPEPEPTGPMSWAALASRTPKHSTQHVRSYEPKKPPVVTAVQSTGDSAMVSKPQSGQRGRDSGGGRGTGGTGGANKDTSRLSGRNAPDNYQVFIGNLPNGLDENQVREAFSKYGKIVEIRLNPKNFGFVIFDSPEPAEAVLKDNTITLGGQEINIEEKKPSGSLGRGGRGGSTGTRGKSGVSGRGGGMSGRGGPSGGKGTGPSTTSGGGRGGGSQRGGNGGGTPGRGRHNRR